MMSLLLHLVILGLFLVGNTSAANTNQLKFTSVVDSAPWPPRYRAHLYMLPKPVTYLNPTSGKKVVTPINSFVFYGGLPVNNDVWLSSDRGKHWALISGVTSAGDRAWSPNDETSFDYSWGPFQSMSSTGLLYRIGGIGASNIVTGEAWLSTDGGITWLDQSASARNPLESMSYWSAGAINSAGQLLLVGGLDWPSNRYSNLQFTSTDQGKNWKTLTNPAAFSGRYGHQMINTQMNGMDVQIMIGGWGLLGRTNQEENYNDVWATSDFGKSWVPMLLSAPFPQRAFFNAAVSKDGLIIISGGMADNDTGVGTATPYNDVWASPDGGWTWGRCVEDAEWSDRTRQAHVIDDLGYYYIASGMDINGAALNDVWKSTISFFDLTAVSSTCRVRIPSCGIGLKCWPGSDTVLATDGSYVSCSSCPQTPNGVVPSSSSSSTGMIVGLVILAIIVGGLLLLILYILNQIRNAGHPPPLPIPQSLWAKNTKMSTNDTNSPFISLTSTQP